MHSYLRTFVANRQTWSLKLEGSKLMNKYVYQAYALCLY